MTKLPVLCLQPQIDAGRILHLTDTHLFASSQGCLLGIDTNASFQAVLDEIPTQQFDLIVATGDFVQDGSSEAYQHFAKQIQRFNVPCVWLPGNHDHPERMQKVFAQAGLASEKVIVIGEQWLLILLDSQVVGQAYGRLSASQYALIAQAMRQYPKHQVMLFLHHHPVLSGCRWLDQHCLRDQQQLVELVKQQPRIQAIICGHIHQVIEANWQQCQILSTPSTCVQFEANCEDFTLAQAAPGWRSINLQANGQFSSRVYYVTKQQFIPDMTQTGY